MSEIVYDLVQHQAKDQYKTDIDQQAATKFAGDELPPPECVNCKIADQPDNSPGSSDRDPVRLKIKAQQARFDSSSNKLPKLYIA